MKKVLVVLFVAFCIVLLSCNTKTETNIYMNKQELNQKTNEELKLIRNEVFARKGYVFKDTLLSNYFKSYNWYVPIKNIEITLSKKEKEYVDLIKNIENNKNNFIKKDVIFDILDKLPLNLGSWEWTYTNRKLFKKSVEKGIHEISNNDGLFKKKYLNSEKIIVNVVDGSWVMKLYKIEDGIYIVITDDIVTGGNDLMAYKYTAKDKNLSRKNFNFLFQKEVINYFLQKENTCKENLKNDNFTAFLDYDFYEQDITMSVYDDISENCLKYREIIFRFNKKTEKFDFLKGILFKDKL